MSAFFLFKTAVLTKGNLLISCHNCRFFSLTAKVFPYSRFWLLNQTSCFRHFAKMFFLVHFSVMLWRWFDDQDFIVVFNFFFPMFEKSWKFGKDIFDGFVDLEKV